jgi:DNA polymerase delta subunit 4
MPPTRRSRTSTGPATKGAQKTLSFGSSKPRITSTKDEKLSTPPSSISSTKPISTQDIDADVGHVSSEAAVAEQAKVEIDRLKDNEEAERSPEELKAMKVTDAQIKRYWRDREAERRAPRVHQEELSVEEKILRLWDMSSQYGVGVSSQ